MGRIGDFHHQISKLLDELAARASFDAVVEPPAVQGAGISWVARSKNVYKGLNRYVIITLLEDVDRDFEIFAGADDQSETRFVRKKVSSLKLPKTNTWESVKTSLGEAVPEALDHARKFKKSDLEQKYLPRRT